MQRRQDRRRDFSLSIQMAQVSARIPTHARWAIAALHNRARVVDELGVAQVQVASRAKHPSVAGVACGQHAVEQIHPSVHGFDQVRWRAQAHEVARALGGKFGNRMLEHLVGQFAAFANREAADGITGGVGSDFARASRGRPAQFAIHAALDDGEQRLMRLEFHRQTTLQPAQRAVGRVGQLLAGHPGVGAFIEGHDHVGAERALDFDGFFRCQVDQRAIERRTELDAVLIDGAQFSETEDLKAPRVGQDRSVVAHEAVKLSQLFDNGFSRTQMQMERVGQNHLRAQGFQIVREQGFDRGFGANGHETRGVHRTVCGLICPAPGIPIGGMEGERKAIVLGGSGFLG